MASQTAITLRQGEANPTDIRLYPLPVADAPASADIYLCGLPQGEAAQPVGITLRQGEAGGTDIRLYPQGYTGAVQDYDIILRPVGQPCGTVARTFALGATEAADAASFAVTVTGGGALIDFALAAAEAQDVAAVVLVRGHPFVLTGSEAPDVAALAVSVASAAQPARGTIIGGFGAYPQPSSGPEWLGKVKGKAARKVERVARAVRAGKVAEEDAAAEVLRALGGAGVEAIAAAQAALDALLRYEAERIAELAENALFFREWQAEQERILRERRNENARRVLMMLTLH